MKYWVLGCMVFLIGSPLSAQEWYNMMQGENPNLFEVQEAYDLYYQTHEFKKSKETQDYKRWVRKMEMYANTEGYYQKSDWSIKDEQDFLLSKQNSPLKNGEGTWEPIGPFKLDLTAAGNSYAPGISRMNTVEVDPNDFSTVYAGTATTGLWKSIDMGNTWNCLTLEMMVKGVGAICIDHSNSNTLFFGANIGIMKSDDGGDTWQTTSLSFPFYDGIYVWEIKMDPINSMILSAATNDGFYRSEDGGENWEKLMDGEFYEIEFHPTQSNIMYLLKENGNKCEFHKSTDGGQSFDLITEGVPNPSEEEDNRRSEISVTAAAPDNVYLLAPGTANGSSGLYGFYTSNDAGESFEFKCCGTGPGGVPTEENLNIMGWQPHGLDEGGQYYYDLALAVSHTDPNRIYTGGINVWISEDGGENFFCNAKWTYEEEWVERYVHADVHDIKIFEEHIWVVSDGGIFHSTDNGQHFTDKTWGINGTEIWGFGAGFKDGDVMMIGTYHNGTLVKDNDVYDGWLHIWGGDTYHGFVNFADGSILYGDRAGKAKVILSNDREVSFSSSSFNKGMNNFTDIEYDPRNPFVIYTCDGNGLWKTEDNAQSWSLVNEFEEGEVRGIKIPWSNPNIHYAVIKAGYWEDARLFKSENAGESWLEISPPSELTGGQAWRGYELAVDNENPFQLWVTMGGYHEGYKVLKSIDGGQSWGDYSQGLPEPGVTAIQHHNGTDGGVYVGTDLGVYYRNNSMANWELYSDGLPISFVRNLQIYYRNGKLRAATDGRGVWEVDLYENTEPIAQIASARTRVNCLDNQVQFYDHSTLNGEGASWLWEFSGGTPASSTEEDPIVSYDIPGWYDVTLTVTVIYGTSIQHYEQFIEMDAMLEEFPVEESFETVELINERWTVVNNDGLMSWQLLEVEQGPDCEPTTVAYMNHFDYNNPTQEDELITAQIDLFDIYNAQLSYDYAYARWGDGYEDGFRIDISPDCGDNWIEVYYAFGADLETVEPQQDKWFPTCEFWQNVSVDLSEYTNETLLIRFVGVNGWGNNFYIDNIEINGSISTDIEELPKDKLVNIFPNPSTDQFIISSQLTDLYFEVFNSSGQSIIPDQILQGTKQQVNLSGYAKGVYYVRLYDGTESWYEKLVLN